MELGYKAAIVAVLGLLLLVLNFKARKRNYDRFRDVHARRKYRVPIDHQAPDMPNEGPTDNTP